MKDSERDLGEDTSPIVEISDLFDDEPIHLSPTPKRLPQPRHYSARFEQELKHLSGIDYYQTFDMIKCGLHLKNQEIAELVAQNVLDLPLYSRLIHAQRFFHCLLEEKVNLHELEAYRRQRNNWLGIAAGIQTIGVLAGAFAAYTIHGANIHLNLSTLGNFAMGSVTGSFFGFVLLSTMPSLPDLRRRYITPEELRVAYISYQECASAVHLEIAERKEIIITDGIECTISGFTIAQTQLRELPLDTEQFCKSINRNIY